MDVGTTPITDELLALRARVKQLESLLQNSELRCSKLDYRLRDLLDRLYGPKGDTLNPAQKLLFGLLDTDELPTSLTESNKNADTAATKKKKGGGRLPKPDNLPVVRKVIDLPEEQKAGLVWMRDEVTKQLEFQPRRFYMLHTVRPVYASPTRAHAPIVAALPPQVIPHAGVGVGFITHVVVSRFVDHLPYYRQESIDLRGGAWVPRQARYRYANAAAHLLINIREQLKTMILRSRYVQIDETFTKLIDPERRGRSHDAYLWGYMSPHDKAIVLEFSPSRSAAMLHHFFPSSWEGDIQSDGARMYPAVEQHYPAFRELRAAADRPLPDFVQQEFEAYLKCGRLEEGFLRVRCEQCHAEKLVAFSCKKRGFCPSCGGRRMAETAALLADEVLSDRPLRQWVLSLPHALRFLLATNSEALTLVLGEVYRTISRHLIGKAGLTRTSGATGAVTLVQRFGSALNLNVHFHMVFLDGAYQTIGAAAPVFRSVAAPESSDMQQLVEQIAGRIGRALERRGLVERDLENAWLARDTEAGPLDDLLGHSITYRIAVGPRAGQKLFTLQTVPPRLQGPEGEPNGAARAGGFSLHAGVDLAPNEREKLERLCRYVSRPPVTSERLALTASGQVRYTLKTPYRDGTTHIVLEPLDLMARLAALVPKPRMHLTRYHGVFAPHSQHRAAVTPAHRGRGAATPPASEADPTKVSTPRHVAMSWARRLKRVFGVEIECCARCGGELKIIASIEEPQLIAKILSHLERAAPKQSQSELALRKRGPPGQSSPL